MKILIALFIAPTLCLSMQSQVGGSRNSAEHVLPLTQSQVAQLPLSTRSVPRLESGALPPSAPYEFRGIRIGDHMKGARQKFLSWKIPSLPFKPGLCGSDGIYRMETCTDVLETGQYVNMTILDQKWHRSMFPRTVAQGETRTTATCLPWRRSTAGRTALTSGKAAAGLQVSLRRNPPMVQGRAIH